MNAQENLDRAKASLKRAIAAREQSRRSLRIAIIALSLSILALAFAITVLIWRRLHAA